MSIAPRKSASQPPRAPQESRLGILGERATTPPATPHVPTSTHHEASLPLRPPRPVKGIFLPPKRKVSLGPLPTIPAGHLPQKPKYPER